MTKKNVISRKRSRKVAGPTRPTVDNVVPSPSCRTGNDRNQGENQVSSVIAIIRALWSQRQTWFRAELSLTNQASAKCRNFVGVKGLKDKKGLARAAALLKRVEKQKILTNEAPIAIAIGPLLIAREPLKDHRDKVEQELKRLAYELPSPVVLFINNTRGVALPSLAAIVGECGSLANYKSRAAVWKRMGMAVINGERQRRIKGDAALDQGYSPRRRAVMWNIGNCLMRAQRAGDPYRDFYDQEKSRQLAKGLAKGHAHRRAVRHMTKTFLADLYGQWPGACNPVQPNVQVPPVQIPGATTT